jgi:3-hydroxyacyl-[acyl-carrier-protein] dehydratase
MKSLSTQDILSILPHRYPFLMIDQVLDYNATSLIALKNFTINEPYVQGHFPGNHIMPGVMMVEAMAQASTILAFKYVEEQLSTTDILKYFGKGTGILFVGADQIKFKKVVVPGEQLKIYTTLTRNARNLFEFDTRVEVDGIIVTEGKLKAAAGL